MAKSSTPVILTGFTAAWSRFSAGNAAEARIRSRRLISRIDAILLDGVFVQIKPKTGHIGQIDVAVLDTKYVGCANQLPRRFPLFLRQIGVAYNLLPFAIRHRAAGLNIARELK